MEKKGEGVEKEIGRKQDRLGGEETGQVGRGGNRTGWEGRKQDRLGGEEHHRL